MLAIYLKELRGYFTSAIGYIFIGMFLFITGIFFTMINLTAGSPAYTNVLQSIIFIFIFIVPVLTMKLISEETKSKTDQLLYTSPLRITDIIVGKYLAAVSIFLISLIITFLYPLILKMFGTISFTEIFSAYIGMFLLGSALIAIGLFVSSLTENQVISAVITLAMMLLIWVIDSIIQGLPSTRTASVSFAIILAAGLALFVYFSTKNILVSACFAILELIGVVTLYLVKKEAFDGLLQKVLGWFSLVKRFDMFSQGILSLSSVIYYLSFSAAFVFLTIRIVDKRRWS